MENDSLLTVKPKGRPNSRARILAAADAVAREVGPGHLSLEAVAERAGISKGGLLYNFPSKAELLKAMVAEHLREAEAELDDVLSRKTPSSVNAMLQFLIRRSNEATDCGRKPPVGLLAAIAENPDLLDPARNFHAKLVECLRRTPGDLPTGLVVYLALEGLRSLDVMKMNHLCPAERKTVLDALAHLAAERSQDKDPSEAGR